MADSGILSLFLSEGIRGRPIGLIDSEQYNYHHTEGEEWLGMIVSRWPHPGGAEVPAYKRATFGHLLADLAPLQPLVPISVATPSVASDDGLPEGMIETRRIDEPDFVSPEELELPS